MKNLIFFLLLSGVFIFFSNCDKDDDDEVQPTYFLTAKVNGDDFTAGTVTAVQTGPFINITAIEGLIGDVMSLSLINTLSPGTYPFTVSLGVDDEVSAGFGSAIPGGISVSAESGNMVITQIDTTAQTVSGTFDFSGEDDFSGDTYNITEGEFNINYN